MKPFVGYLAPPRRGATAEERRGWDFLANRTDLRARLVKPEDPDMPGILWWHTDSLRQPSPDLVAFLSRHILEGGSLLLTLCAFRWLKELGLEQRAPDVVRSGAWTERPWAPAYPDLRGFGGYLGHPVFAGLGGGAFTWVARTGVHHAATWYAGDGPVLRGRVLAVERRYIRLAENRITGLEYRHRGSRTLALGCHVYFADAENPRRDELACFIANCLRYLDPAERRNLRGTRRTYWPQGTPTCHVEQLPRARRSARTPPPEEWRESSGLELSRNRSTHHPFNVGGRRVLLLGTERAGVTEVWTHPVRILQDLHWQVRPEGAQPLTSRNACRILAAPEAFRREFRSGGCGVTETTVGSPRLPAGTVRLDIRNARASMITISGRIDLRLMWPLSERASGDLVCRRDASGNAIIVEAAHSGAAAVVGCAPVPGLVQIRARGFDPERTSAPVNAHVEFTVSVRLARGNHSILLVVAGSGRGTGEAMRAWRSMQMHPDDAYRGQVRSTLSILRRTERHAPAEPRFRQAWRQAVVSLHRFIVTTPGLGTSLMAGFGDTLRGWDGGHSVNGRPGYAWYFGRDSVWSALGLLACGSLPTVRGVLRFLGRHQDVEGRIAHEITTTGHAHYDAADAAPLYAILMGRYLRASGDTLFCRQQYTHLLRAMAWSASTDTDGDGFIENTSGGHGWIEGGALFPPHAELYLNACWAAAQEEAAYVGRALGRMRDVRRWSRGAADTWKRIWRVFPHPVTRFPAFALRRDGRLWREETALAAVALAFGRPPADVAGAVTARLAAPSFLTTAGVRMVSDESRIYNPSGYHTGSIWPLFTGWAMLGAMQQGQAALARQFLGRNASLFARFSLGHVPEVLHGETGRPAGVCDHQAWSDAMVVLGNGVPP